MKKKGQKKTINLTLSEFMECVSNDPGEYSILTKSLVADMLGKSQAWVIKNISDGVLDTISLENEENGRITKYVSQRSVLDFEKKVKHEDDREMSKINKILLSCARKKETIFYSDLMKKIGMDYRVPRERSKIGSLLGTMSEESYEKYGVMISALVISKREKMPSGSFFVLAEEDLEHESCDDYETDKEFYEAECEKVYKLVEQGKIK